MNHGPHTLIGLGTGLALGAAGFGPLYGMALAAAVASTLPDIDQRWAAHWAVPGAPCRLFDHRGPTHSLLAAVLLGGLLGAATDTPWLGIALTAGCASHLVSDGLSPMGVPYLWPLTARRFRLLPRAWRVRSASWLNWPISVGAVALAARCAGIL